jgi:nitroreductase
MNTLEAISQRRSIRRFKPAPIPDDALETILTAGIQAPSGKNRQPWHFVVVREDKRAEMVRLMRQGIERLKGWGANIGSAEHSARIMEQAPITVFVFNEDVKRADLDKPQDIGQYIGHMISVQSIGAAIQNMLLAAHELGVGSLWIADVFVAPDLLGDFCGQPYEMVAAVSFGYADEQPAARPRKPVSEVTTWL